MHANAADTIAAIATPPGEGGIGIVRVSGPKAFEIAQRVWKDRHASVPLDHRPSHTIHLGRITDRRTNEVVDEALLLLFKAPHSYTGEDVVEFSCHGGPVILARAMTLLLREGARPAQPGEFTQRAFLNGRMDLAQAEAVCDLIRAKTEDALRLAVMQQQGRLSQEVARIRNDLVGILAAVEVTLDFSDEVGDLDTSATLQRIQEVHTEIRRLLASAHQGRLYREGARLAIVGRPNVGKSSLLNALLRFERAIVTPIPGTTRDVIEDVVNIAGIPVTVMDTAGIRPTEDPVEQIGVQRTRSTLKSATAIVLVLDASEGWTPEDEAIAADLQGVPSIWALNKKDLIPADAAALRVQELAQRKGDGLIVPVSALLGEGIASLEEAVARILHAGASGFHEGFMVTNARHQAALSDALAALDAAQNTIHSGLPPDFISIDLRGALDALGAITGETASEEVIHRIFSDFCIGK
ncbi:MAG: tRNA uridine-5-carboxymethylaminomethyl(34) synthesis GTPase MnmE [Chthonomonadales bacterium]